MIERCLSWHSCLLILSTCLSSCISVASEPVWKKAVAGDGPGNPELIDSDELVEVRNLPKSRIGNPSDYEVFGKRYRVMDSAEGFSQQGIASWYGSKFHGNATSSGEIYDMHKLTAAHKHLPLPTFVQVTRVDNGQSIIVKVNDRGPFVDERIIDLSYGAAAKLDMLGSGKSEVVVKALSSHARPGTAEPVNAVSGDDSAQAAEPVNVPDLTEDVRAQAAEPELKIKTLAHNRELASMHYLQVGAYSKAPNAEAKRKLIVDNIQLPAKTHFDENRGLYRVNVGPLANQASIDKAMRKLLANGLTGFTVERVVQ